MRVLLCAGLIMLAGCATADLSAGRALATAGQDAARTAASVHGESDLSARNYVARQEVLVEIVEGQSALTEAERRSLEQIGALYRARRAVLQDFANAYAAFGALAEYDAHARYGAALEEFDASYTNLAQAIGVNPQGLSSTVNALPSVLSFIANARRSRVLVAQSPHLRVRALALAELLSEDSDVFDALYATHARQSERLSIALWRGGFLSARELFVGQDLAPGFGLSDDDAIYRASNARADTIVVTLARMRADNDIAAYQRKRAATIATLRALANEHESFEQSQRVDLAEIMRLVSELRELAGAS